MFACLMMGLVVPAMLAMSVVLVMPARAVSEKQEAAIVEKCSAIRDSLETVQHLDTRARVYLGRYYEAILTKFMTPLNMRLVENNLSESKMIENQSNFVKTRTIFTVDYIEYQKAMDGLVATSCENEPGKFYDKLVEVRNKRAIVAKDTVRMRTLMTEHVNLVKELRGTL